MSANVLIATSRTLSFCHNFMFATIECHMRPRHICDFGVLVAIKYQLTVWISGWKRLDYQPVSPTDITVFYWK